MPRPQNIVCDRYSCARSIRPDRRTHRGLTEDESNGVLEHLITGGDFSLYGLANAVTRFSQDVESYDRATKLEEIGYSVMTMSPALFRQMNRTELPAA